VNSLTAPATSPPTSESKPAARDRLTAGIFVSADKNDITGCLEYALERTIATEPIERRLRDNKLDTVEEGLAAGVITEAEAALLTEAAQAVRAAIMVDDFAPEEIAKGALQSQSKDMAAALSM